MFDVGFSELVVVALVALVVIGPKDLPRVARIAGMWLGRARRTLATVKGEIDRELQAQELKDILEKQARSNPLETLIEESRPAQRPSPDATPNPTKPAPVAPPSPKTPGAGAG